MPFKRKFKKLRRFKKKLPTWKKMVGITANKALDYAGNVPGPIGTVARGLKLVKNLINVEAMFVDTAINQAAAASAQNAIPLAAIAQGDTDSSRQGDSILAKSLVVRLSLTNNASATTSLARMIIFIDKENANGTAPTSTLVLQQDQVQGLLNMNNSERFPILRDKSYALRTSTESAITWITEYIDLSDLHIRFDGTTSAQGSLSTNHPYVLFISSEATNTPSFVGNIRLRYYDN